MIDFLRDLPTLGVFPVLVGPLQTLLALLPAILLGLGSLIVAAFRPAGFLKLVRFCWRQKLFLGCVAGIIAGWHYGLAARSWQQPKSVNLVDVSLSLPGDVDPTAATAVWTNDRDRTVLSSPVVSGDRVFFATATDIGPFSPEGRGAIVCVSAHTGQEIWRYAPADYRATFSSPIVSDGYVVCGEGLHQVQDARVTCLDHHGRRKWEFRTQSHVESTVAIADGRVFVGAGDDGFYCLALEPEANGMPRVVWHLEGHEFPDCESSPVVSDGIVYFGLGEGGHAICAVDAATGQLRWRVETPYPVFAPPKISQGKLYVATGNGNYVQSATDLLEMKLQLLTDDGASEQELADARRRLQPAGEMWCIELASRHVAWKFAAADAILGAIACGDESLYFGSRDGHLYRVSLDGRLLNKFNLHEPLVCSPALGRQHVYCTTASGRLVCLEAVTLKSVWELSLGVGEPFTSSPVLAHGHVYVGTAQQGLRCLGRPGKSEPPVWTHGDRGGCADDVPVPEMLTIAWRFPAEDSTPFLVTAPLMPLADAIYAAGSRGGASEFVKLDANVTTRDTARQVWVCRFDRPLVLPPVGCGERLCVIESDALPPTILHCLSASDGHILWSHRLRDSPIGLTLDSHNVFAWTSASTLGCWDLASGAMQWEETTQSQRGLGSPAVRNQIIFAATESSLSARDAPTGTLLWNESLNGRPRGGPFLEGQNVLLPYDVKFETPAQSGFQASRAALAPGPFMESTEVRGLTPAGSPTRIGHVKLAVQNVVDGKFVRWQAATDETDRWVIPDAVGTPITPRVSHQGRVYFATEQGAVVCLGADAP